MNPPAALVVVQGSACLFREGCPSIKGLVQLKRGAPRPSITIFSDNVVKFSVSLAGLVKPERDKEDPRNIFFNFPIDPFDRVKLCFDSPINAENFYNKLRQIEDSIAFAQAAKNNVIYRSSSGQRRGDRVRSEPLPSEVVQPRPISAAPPSSLVKELSAKLSLEAPAKLTDPPPPPKRHTSLRQHAETPSPKSSSLPSTSGLLPPQENRSSRSLDLLESSNSMTETLKPQKSPTNSQRQPRENRRQSLAVEDDDLEKFYPQDITLIRHLERGSQGAVDLASTKFYRRVAVKYFDRRVKQWENSATRELCYLLKTVTHPNIVQFRGILFASPSEKDKPMGILMEYMDGGSVHEAIYNNDYKYTVIEPLNWCRQAASALAFLHKKRLVHRDVKPANMLLCDGRKRLKISDFGLCSTVDMTMTADVGTVIYMAPEVVGRGNGVTYDEKCDVYSLGVSFWEMIHRQRPHDGFGFLALLSAVREGTRPQFNQLYCTPEIQQLIERMWAEDSSDRPRMEEVFETVADFLDKTGFFEIYE